MTESERAPSDKRPSSLSRPPYNCRVRAGDTPETEVSLFWLSFHKYFANSSIPRLQPPSLIVPSLSGVVLDHKLHLLAFAYSLQSHKSRHSPRLSPQVRGSAAAQKATPIARTLQLSDVTTPVVGASWIYAPHCCAVHYLDDLRGL